MPSFYICKGKPNKGKVCAVIFLPNARSLALNLDTPQQQGLISSLITKVINNLQVTVKNIHIRYEDRLSVPGVSCNEMSLIPSLIYPKHPFATGITLAGFTATSVNDQWLPAFIDSTASVIHKVCQIWSLGDAKLTKVYS